jgi:hypothetical protein
MRKFPIADLTEPSDVPYQARHIYRDHWWPVSPKDEIFFWGDAKSPYRSPQCNENKAIADRRSRMEPLMEGTTVQQIPIIYTPVNWSDYDH